MKVIVDKSMASVGITDVVYAFAKGLDAGAEIPGELEETSG